MSLNNLRRRVNYLKIRGIGLPLIADYSVVKVLKPLLRESELV